MHELISWGNDFPGRSSARRDVVHRASGATNRGDRFAPPKAGFFHGVAALRAFADAPHRHVGLAWPRREIIPVKRFHLIG